MRHISIGGTVRFSLSFLVGNVGAVARRVTIPFLVGWGVLYCFFDLYLIELQHFLANPTDRNASLVLGVAVTGLLLMLFLHAMIAAAVAALALGLAEHGGIYFRAKRREWRLYAAELRFVFLTAIFVGAVVFARFAARPWMHPGWEAAIEPFLIVLGIFVLLVRVGFLISPISVAEAQGEIVRRAWRLSGANTWRIFAIVIVLMLPGLALYFAGDFLMRASGAFPMPGGAVSFSAVAASFRDSLPAFLVALSVSYVISTILLTAAAVFVYRELVDVKQP